MMKSIEIYTASFSFLITLYALWRLRRRSGLKNIPGPRRLPLIGNLLDWPSEYQYEQVEIWKRTFGPMIKLSIFGKTAIFLGTGRSISELFAKRSSEFSDRPELTFSGELCGLNSLHPMTQFGSDFRQQRKLMKEVLGGDVIRKQEALLTEEAIRLLEGIFADPKAFDRSLRRFSTSLSLRMIYGFEAMEIDDPHILLAEEMMRTSEYAVIAGWAVDFLPVLKHLPRWFPGAGFKKKAEYYGSMVHKMVSTPFEEVRDAITMGKANDSFAGINIKRILNGSNIYDELLIKTTATAMYGGASDTIASASWSFVLGVLINQEAQAKAQQEIDKVTGRTRLPCMSDRNSMPYLSAMVWETFRWSPPVPLTLPHRARFDYEFDGYSIAKDDVLLGSLWSVTREEEYHSDAGDFDPDRYFEGKNERYPYYVFGYGHRRCPGADMAFAQLFHQAAYILSVFNIRPEVDAKGNPVFPTPEFVGEMVRHPKPFQCVITPRWKDAHFLVKEAKNAYYSPAETESTA